LGAKAGSLRSRVLTAAAVLIALGILSAQLFVRPIVGLADNGDFIKVMTPTGLAYTTDLYAERYWQWTLTEFRTVNAGRFPGEYKTSETLLAKAARALTHGPMFDIRALGAIHVALLLAFLVLVGLAVTDLSLPAQALALGLSVFFFTDVGYAAPFNSLYSQTASLLFLLLTLGIAAHAIRDGGASGWRLLAYFACAALFVISKPQEFIQGPLLALLGLRLAAAGRRRLAAFAAIALCAFSLWYYSLIPRRTISEVGLYHTVFMELLPDSPDPERDLKDLGLDPGLARYSGITGYAPNAPLADPAFRRRYFERFGYRDVVRFYVTHPRRFLHRLRLSGSKAFDLRPANLANFDQRSGRPPGTLSRAFDAWSSARASLGRHGGLVWIVLLLGGNLAAASLYRPRTPKGALAGNALAILCVMAGVEFLVCSLADFLADVSRHLYVFQAMCDVLLIADLVWLAEAVGVRRRHEVKS
jgi:hypothetical protein